jgi:hypothetical protein
MQAVESKANSQSPRWPLWSLFWWTLLIGPILMPIGLIVLIAVIVSILHPPIYTIFLFLDGRFFVGGLLLAAWLIWLRFGLRLLRWLLQGVESADL